MGDQKHGSMTKESAFLKKNRGKEVPLKKRIDSKTDGII
jgi:hypothetical protein